MNDFENKKTLNGFTMKLWRGERMCLLGFDVDTPEPDFVGFAIECRGPGDPDFQPLPNRIAFSYDEPVSAAVTGERKFPSTEAPFQKFRWLHFPFETRQGIYTYRATKMHMPKKDNKLKKGTQIELDISLDPVTYDGFLDIGFTRNFASSQAFVERFKDSGQTIDEIGLKILPNKADDGLAFTKMEGDIYEWLGFEAYDLMFGMLDEAVNDPSIEFDVFAYDLNEPGIVGKLEQMGSRLRVIVDDSTAKKKNKKTGVIRITGHGTEESAETQSAERLIASAGAANVKRLHFDNLQHHKVFIAKRNGKPFKVLTGSTNFSYRGVYIQANNVLVFSEPQVAELYEKAFEIAFNAKDTKDAVSTFRASELSSKWHLVSVPGKPPIHFCFSPHKEPELSLSPLSGAVTQAASSVFYAVAFLNQIQSGSTFHAFKGLIGKPIFSYGISDKAGGMEVKKPDQSTALVDFKFLSDHAPQPFKREWSGGKGINVHHKFVVTDFNLPTAKVFVGSSNFAVSGEESNGDHLIMIEDCKIATSYAIEAIRVFDHLHFRSKMKDAEEKKDSKKDKTTSAPLTLRKPVALSTEKNPVAWFAKFYVGGSQPESDRKLFSS